MSAPEPTTADLIEAARHFGATGEATIPMLHAALAERLAELEALEPVRRLLSRVAAGDGFGFRIRETHPGFFCVDTSTGHVYVERSPLEALAQLDADLADAVGEGGRA